MIECRLLEEVLQELVDEMPRALVRIVGPVGGGKTRAVGHLAAVFAHDERFAFFDDATPHEIQHCRDKPFVVVTGRTGKVEEAVDLRLAPWGVDELIEYLFSTNREQCGSVMARLGTAARESWLPQIATLVLDRFAADPSAVDPVEELYRHICQCLPRPEDMAIICRFCLAVLTVKGKQLERAAIDMRNAGFLDEVPAVLGDRRLQRRLAAETVFASLVAGTPTEIEQTLPREVVESVGTLCRSSAAACEFLRTVLKSAKRDGRGKPMAASILHAADPTWRPGRRWRNRWLLRGACFRGAHWPGVHLQHADLAGVDFTSAHLEQASLAYANLGQACFDGAILPSANLEGVEATSASFSMADLRGARLDKARLHLADFSGADLSGASLVEAVLGASNLSSSRLSGANLSWAELRGATLDDVDLTGVTLVAADLNAADLRTASLAGANLESALLARAQMEDLHLPDARMWMCNLRGAFLTGSVMPRADLRSADLSGAHLAEIDWEGANLICADLSGATFHMGSSRSGLVGSPIACEGSKTGFYGDDFHDMHFKRAEEVRKANLRGADLRGARLSNLDLYLVDLRDARLDPEQLDYARQCGAILEDVVA